MDDGTTRNPLKRWWERSTGSKGWRAKGKPGRFTVYIGYLGIGQNSSFLVLLPAAVSVWPGLVPGFRIQAKVIRIQSCGLNRVW